MSTLSNVDTRRGGTSTSYTGLTSSVSPEVQMSSLAKNLQIGVSVRYAENPRKKWFVLRATYGRAIKAYHIITDDNEEAYIPMRYVLKKMCGKMKRIMVPLLPNIIFVYASVEYVSSLVKDNPKASFINYYLNHFKQDDSGKNPPLTVGYNEMMNFIRVTSIINEHIKTVESSQCRYKSGDLVKIVDGDFKGIQGKVARVAGQQRVIVEIEGLCLVATAYIPTAFIEPLCK